MTAAGGAPQAYNPSGLPQPHRPLGACTEVSGTVVSDDGVIIEELESSKDDCNAGKSAAGGIPLPANRPGLLGVGPPSRTKGGPFDRDPGKPVTDVEEIRRIALQEAEAILPREMTSMLFGETYAQVATMLQCEKATPAEELWRPLAERLVDVIWAPLGGCRPKLVGAGELDLKNKMELFWRCAVALCMMPLSQLSMLSNRKKAFLSDIEQHLPAEGAEPGAARLAHIRLNLPIFAMTANMPGDDAPSKTTPEPVKEDVKTAEAPEKLPDREAGEELGETEQPEDEEEEQAAEQAAAEEKKQSAAKHTYDKGYSKWDKFDVEKACREIDRPNLPTTHTVKMTPEAPLLVSPENPVQALDEAIQALEAKGAADKPIAPEAAAEASTSEEAAAEASADATPLEASGGDSAKAKSPTGTALKRGFFNSAPKAADDKKPSTPKEAPDGACEETEKTKPEAKTEATKSPLSLKRGFLNSAPKPDAVQKVPAPHADEPKEPPKIVDEDGCGESATAASLNREYQKWETFDDLSDDDDDDCSGLPDLDAMTGPKEELERIRTHWKRTQRASKQKLRAASKPVAQKTLVRMEKPSEAEQAPAVTARPCEYHPPSSGQAKTAQAIHREYNKWKTIDTDAMLLDMDNEGKTEEGDKLRCDVRKKSGMIMAEDYKKDREEYDLDEDIATHSANLKKLVGQNLKDGTGLKAEGNRLMRDGRAKEACDAYALGIQAMDLAEQSFVLMSDSMEDKSRRLLADLHRNLAAAQLAAGNSEGAVASCDAALKLVPEGGEDDKAVYRRASALLKLGRIEQARPDIERLAKCCGEDDAAVKKLRAACPAGPTPGPSSLAQLD
eukprot:TRINITY_DN123284_c0_g1_i1.p1 TRINITY_DN123284_c0_g1~~TRINITY_DN123284_c0_g1_i1.p1  ORF type:complete len:843 (+),score=257.47 TRINITY_DN123284_c0_g1_i1:81-2609(+)